MEAPADGFPPAPDLPQELLEKCRRDNDFRPALFEWYKYTGIVCNLLTTLRIEGLGPTSSSPLHRAVLVGLLNRCARLMVANVVLAHEHRFGETTAILDRCIFESCVKVMWLCRKNDDEAFRRFIADGLRTETIFKARIQENIEARGGDVWPIEARMLASIERTFQSGELTEKEVGEAGKLPNLAAMIEDVGLDRLFYIVGQRIGSHHVHGTWPSLVMHYLELDGGRYEPRDHDCSTHVNQFVFIPLVVLDAMRAFATFMTHGHAIADALFEYFNSIEREIRQLNEEGAAADLPKSS